MLDSGLIQKQKSLPGDFVRELKLDRASLDVEARYGRCEAAWKPHLERTRAVILRSAGLATARRKAVLLGAGLVHDIPLAELSGLFQEVVLVDLVHSRSCRMQAAMLPNITCLQADVTDTASHLISARRSRAPLQRIEPELFKDDEAVDFIVSVNVLSQLGCAPAEFLRASHSPEEIRGFQRHLVEAHLKYLRQFRGHSALITDVAWSRRPVNPARQGSAVRREVVHRVLLPPPPETWDWLIAPVPESDPDHDLIAHVAAYPDWKAASSLSAG
jgi:hypothetical protein